jgi:hypothetical protein
LSHQGLSGQSSAAAISHQQQQQEQEQQQSMSPPSPPPQQQQQQQQSPVDHLLRLLFNESTTRGCHASSSDGSMNGIDDGDDSTRDTSSSAGDSRTSTSTSSLISVHSFTAWCCQVLLHKLLLPALPPGSWSISCCVGLLRLMVSVEKLKAAMAVAALQQCAAEELAAQQQQQQQRHVEASSLCQNQQQQQQLDVLQQVLQVLRLQRQLQQVLQEEQQQQQQQQAADAGGAISEKQQQTHQQQQQQQQQSGALRSGQYWRRQLLRLYRQVRPSGLQWVQQNFDHVVESNDRAGFWGLVGFSLRFRRRLGLESLWRGEPCAAAAAARGLLWELCSQQTDTVTWQGDLAG